MEGRLLGMLRRGWCLAVLLLGQGLAPSAGRGEPSAPQPAPSPAAQSPAAQSPAAHSPAAVAAEEEGTADFTLRSNVVYHRVGERELAADLWLPARGGPHPAILMIHGGAWLSGNKFTMRRHAEPAARRGYAVMAINYRLAPGSKFPAQIEDCRAAVCWLRTNAEELRLDPRRIAAFGYSAGGQLASLLGASGDERLPAEEPAASEDWRVQAVVAGGAPCDFTELDPDSTWLAYWLGGPRREFEERYREASPRSFVSPNDPPMFFFHGAEDRLVPLSSPRAMRRRLVEAGVRAELFEIERAGHLGAFLDRNATARSLEFLDTVFEHRSTAE